MIYEPEQFTFRFATGKTIQERFESFHAANPWVYRELVRMAYKMKERGRKKVGIKFLAEVLRWNYYMTTADAESEWKICNSYLSRYTRLIDEQEPDLKDFLTRRKLKSK